MKEFLTVALICLLISFVPDVGFDAILAIIDVIILYIDFKFNKQEFIRFAKLTCSFMKGVIFMAVYTVKEVSEKFNVNPETVRRWVRKGIINADMTSKKCGMVINELEFVKLPDKYRLNTYKSDNPYMLKITLDELESIRYEVDTLIQGIKRYMENEP